MSDPKVGNLAPAFTLIDHSGKKVSLKDFKNKNHVVLYFYPKAMTPGCTVQAKGIKTSYSKFTRKGIVVLGVSPDSTERLKKFKDKEKLNFKLLSDEDHKIADKYGAWGLKRNYGKEYMGIYRKTYIIGKDGKLKNIFSKVNTKSHDQDVLAWMKENLF